MTKEAGSVVICRTPHPLTTEYGRDIDKKESDARPVSQILIHYGGLKSHSVCSPNNAIKLETSN